jgi:PAS domain S-box-containing protein
VIQASPVKNNGLWQAAIILLLTLGLECLFLNRANDFIESKIDESDTDLRTEASTSAVILKETLTRFLEQLDALHGLARLVTVARQTGDLPMERAAMDELGQWQGNMRHGVRYIGAIDPSGILDWTNLKAAVPRVSLSDREYFRAIAQGGAESFVGTPVTGQVSGQLGIHFTKSMRAADGALLAVTMIDVDPRMLSDLARIAGLTASDTLMIVRRDGVILTRSGADQYIGRVNPPESPHMRAFLGSQSGLVQGISPIDGADRVAAWQQIEQAGLILVVALDRGAHRARFQPTMDRSHRWIELTAALIALMGVGSIVILQWRLRFAMAEAQMDIAHQSERLFRDMAESLPDLVRLADANGVVRYANEATRELLGIEPNDLVGLPVNAFVHADDLAKMVVPTKAFAPTATPLRSELRLLRPDGQTIWAQTSLRTVVRDTMGLQSWFMISVTRDVTVQRQAEAALRLAKEELDAMLTATRAVLYRARVDSDGDLQMQFVSDSALHLIGYTPAEIVGMPNWFADHFDPAFAKERHEHLRRVLTQGSSRTKYRLRQKDGHWLWVSMFSRRVEGEGYMIVGTATDVSREHERDLQLAQSAKMAMLGEMSTGMAHELNQPLTAIGMMAENSLACLETNASTPDLVGGKLERILDQVRRAGAIIDHMRIFGRKSDGPPGPVAVAGAIEGATSVLSNRLRQARIGLVTHIEQHLPPVTGHLVRLEQVLVNLIANAADAIEAHSPALPRHRRDIGINASLVDGMIEIAVTDHAGGIDETLIPRLFEPFFTTKPVGRGTGLGLSISYGIITDMGGLISAHNRDNGTVMILRLPEAGGGDLAAHDDRVTAATESG